MQYRGLVTLLPCHSLEDFPVHHTGQDAEGLLAAWCAPWHPALIASAGQAPTWRRVDEMHDTIEDHLLIVPSISRNDSARKLAERASQQPAVLIDACDDLDELTGRAIEPLPPEAKNNIPSQLANDFQTLGYWYLQVQLLTRQMRYTSNLDETHFQEQLIQAAVAAMAGNEETAREHLSRCYGVLAEERDHYYPVDAFLLDITLVSPSTCGRHLAAELSVGTPLNVLINGDTLDYMSSHHPSSIAALRAMVDADKAALVGGEQGELPLPLISSEQLLAEFERGVATFERHLGQRPRFYGRRRFGLGPVLPQLLEKLGYRGALHATLDDGRFPEGTQARTQWQGVDGTTVDALATVPLDAARPETFLNLATRMGESMELDYVATVCLAHWPGHSSRWYDYLRRGAAFGLALGRFATLDEYFDHTSYTSQVDPFESNRYVSPYLVQSVARGTTDPISRCVGHWRRHARLAAAANLCAWAELLGVAEGELPSDPVPLVTDPTLVDNSTPNEKGQRDEDSRIDSTLEQIATVLSKKLARDGQGERGMLVLNPWSMNGRWPIKLAAEAASPTEGKPVYAFTQDAPLPTAVVDVPECGFAFVGSQPVASSGANKPERGKRKSRSPLVDQNVLRNDFLEAHIDPKTGALRSLYDFETRGNRLSQQLAFRFPRPVSPPGTESTAPTQPVYSTMFADTLEVTRCDSVIGEITSRGRLTDGQDETIAEFRQTYRLSRGSRVLVLEIELSPRRDPGAAPWDSYYACRFAWADETNILYRDLNGVRQMAGKRRFETAAYIDIDGATQRTQILTGGLPYHRPMGGRRMDSLLIVRGETCRTFQLGIGVQLRQPLAQAHALFVDPIVILDAPSPPTPTGWLFHISARNVMATHWEPLWEVSGEPPRRTIVGFRVRLLEAAGQSGPVRISAFRSVQSACKRDFLGNELSTCQVEDGQIGLDLAAHEWTEVEGRW